jgi:thiol-disulfide isomerase/thioredoxin
MLLPRRLPLALSLLLVTLLFEASALAEDARPLLRSVAQNYRDMTSYHFEFTREQTFVTELSRGWDIGYATLARDRSGRYHYAVKDNAMGWRVVISDGKSEWIWQPWVGEYTEKPAGTQPQIAAPPKIKAADAMKMSAMMEAESVITRLSRLDDMIRSAELLGPELISINGEELRCSLVRVVYQPPGTPANSSRETLLWIDPQRKVVRKEHTIERGRFTVTQPLSESTNVRVTTYHVMQLGAEPPETLFRFRPPASARFVEQFSPLGTNTRLVGRTAPPLQLKTLEGKEVFSETFRGKPLLVDFWATWCKPCVKQMPVISKLHTEFKDKGLIVVGVNKDQDPKVATAFLEKNQYRWLNLYDEGLQASKLWETDAIPTLAVVDRAGKIVFVSFGASENDEAEIRSALAKVDPAFDH